MRDDLDDPKLIELTVARRLAALRRDRGWTLRQLGEQTNLSDAYLSRVENGLTAVTIANLARLANALGVEMRAFFEVEIDRQPITICRAGEGKKMRFRGPHGTRVTFLAEKKKAKLMEPILVDVGVASPDLPLQGHAGEEFNYVIEGRCRMAYGTDEFILNTGDAVYYDATVPHSVRPINKKACRMIAVVTSLDHKFHSNIVKVLEDRLQY